MSEPIDEAEQTQEDPVVYRFAKNSREEVRIRLETFHGQDILHIRAYYRSRDEYLPGKQGIAIRQELLPELLAGLKLAKERLPAELQRARRKRAE